MRRIFDRVHGDVYLDADACVVVHTTAFARLHDVRQLGACSYVYPSATHTRLEHSIGVAHLAGTLARHLQGRHPDMIDDRDVACAVMAGLCHDLGHGPFSHLFEEYMRKSTNDVWSHEDMTLRIIDHIARDVQTSFTPQDWVFVKILVTGHDPDAPWPESTTGRPQSRRVLADVLHNRATGLDVDKMDYLARDALVVFGETHSIDLERILTAADVDEATGRLVFGARAACAIDNLHALRTRLHVQLYQHRNVLLVDGLLRDLMHTHIPDLATRAADVTTFLTLTDPIIDCIPAHETLALWTRPWTLVGEPVALCVHPRCHACGATTGVGDSFCAACGASTRDRHGVLCGDGLTTPAAVVTDAQATRAVRAIFGAVVDAAVVLPTLRIHISNVRGSVRTATVDPHDRRWYTHTPHVRTLYCFAHASTPCDAALVHRAIRAWIDVHA